MKLSLRALVAGSFSKVWWYQIPEGKPQKLEFQFPVSLIEVKRFLREKFSLKRLPAGTLIQTLPIKALSKQIERLEFKDLGAWKKEVEEIGYRLVNSGQDYEAWAGKDLRGSFSQGDGWLQV